MKILKAILLAVSLTFTSASIGAEVNINTMDAQSIADNLNGIGIKKAQAIVAYRKANGPFASVDELTKVRGIGQKTLAKIKNDIRLTGSESN